MINDYRFRTESYGGKAVSRFIKPGLATLLLLASAGAGHWVWNNISLPVTPANDKVTAETDEPQTLALALPERRLLPASGSNTQSLALQTSPDSQPPNAAVQKPSSNDKPARIQTAALMIKPGEATTSSVTTESQPDTPASTTSNDQDWIQEKVKKGDSLARIFSRLGLSANLLHRIVNSSPEAKQLARIKPGETIKVLTDDAGEFVKLVLERNAIRSLHIQTAAEGFTSRVVERGLEKRIAESSGTITSSLYQSAQRAGLSDDLTMELANIFGWDIDFALEIRAGDSFSLIYEEEYLDGEVFDNGDILAAEFVNRGKVFRAIRFQDEKGNTSYYSPDGRSMRKAFLRAPVDFRRISSRFTKARWHPVLGKKRPHKGVDYAAATGTPIKASGDGRVVFRGRKGGYGKTLIIKHGSQYKTLYAHMSRFNKKVKKGSRVQQGQVIGYVGKTGLATGPHLHYEFRVNGVHRNPLKVKIPAASPIDKKYKADFQRQSKPLLAQLDLISRTQLATAE